MVIANVSKSEKLKLSRTYFTTFMMPICSRGFQNDSDINKVLAMYHMKGVGSVRGSYPYNAMESIVLYNGFLSIVKWNPS